MSASEDLDRAIQAVTNLKKLLSRRKSRQVTSIAECSVVKATAQAWFKSQRTGAASALAEGDLRDLDEPYRRLLESSERHATRAGYKTELKTLRKRLVKARSKVIASEADGDGTSETVLPDLTKLIPDPAMQAIVARRWEETLRCIKAGAPLAATVMMGGLLEGLLLTRANRLGDFGPLFKAATAPKDSKSGKPLQLKDWKLRNYLDVAHELGWIRQAAHDVGVVLRDYRNYIHPAKELSHGVMITDEDAEMFWQVFASLASQIAAGVY